jgi:hypothetical protein
MTPGRNDDLLRALTQISRRERRDRLRQALDVVKTAQKRGLQIRSATIEGVVLELAEGAPAKAASTPLEVWMAKRNAGQA